MVWCPFEATEEGGHGPSSQSVRGATGEVGVDRSSDGCLVVAKVEDATHEGEDGAEVVMATAGVANLIATRPVLLRGEREEHERRREEVAVGSLESGQPVAADEEFHVGPAEGVGIGVGDRILARAHEKVECYYRHVAAGVKKGRGRRVSSGRGDREL